MCVTRQEKISIVLAGDFNAKPYEESVKLILKYEQNRVTTDQLDPSENEFPASGCL